MPLQMRSNLLMACTSIRVSADEPIRPPPCNVDLTCSVVKMVEIVATFVVRIAEGVGVVIQRSAQESLRRLVRFAGQTAVDPDIQI